MPTNYDAKAQKAHDMVLAKGRVVQVRLLATTPPADPAKPWRGVADPRASGTVVNCPVVQADGMSASALGFTIKDDEAKFKASEVKYIAAPGPGIDLTLYDEVVDGAETYTINALSKLQPGQGSAILYFLGCSR